MAYREILQIAPGQWAGHMRIYHRECLELAKAGYNVTLLAHPTEGEQYSQLVRVYSLGKLPAPTYRLYLFQRLIRNLKAFYKALMSNALIFHYHSPEFIPFALLLSIIKKQPIIFDCMEDFESYVLQRPGLPDWMRPMLSELTRGLLLIAAKHCQAVITSDAGMGQYFQKVAKKIVILRNFPSLVLFPDPKTLPIVKEYDLVFHGSLDEYINICLTIDDVLIGRGYLLHWCFIGEMPNRDDFIAILEKMHKKDRFDIKNRVPHDHVAQEVLNAKIGIIPLPDLPKYHTNVAQKMFEYMALKIPIVMSDLPPCRSFVKHRESALLVPPDNINEYASAIISLLTDSALVNKLVENGRLLFENIYNWEKESKKLIELYNDLLVSA
jgi:glycosyltransferase involved in cell wall biosynthesis